MHENANREFRKIPSLKYLYEINENGTIVRNVKSKKQLKIKLDYHNSKRGYYTVFVPIGRNKPIRILIHRIVAECWLGKHLDGYEVNHRNGNIHDNNYRNLRYVLSSKTDKTHVEQNKFVTITNSMSTKYFISYAECARWFVTQYPDTTFETIRQKLKAKRRHIYDYDIKYLSE